MIVGGFIFLSSDPRALDPSDNKIYKAITIVAPSANTGTVYVGSNISQLIPLSPNTSIVIWHDKLTDIFVQDANTGDKILWFTGRECNCGCNCPKKMK